MNTLIQIPISQLSETELVVTFPEVYDERSVFAMLNRLSRRIPRMPRCRILIDLRNASPEMCGFSPSMFSSCIELVGIVSRVDIRGSILLPSTSMAKVITSAMALMPMSFPVRITQDVDDAETFVGIALPTQQPVHSSAHRPEDSGANQRAPSH